ncbi:hypothetical protein [Halobacteriovorax sp. HFRX-2_2]|uniref:hypothetical protein n=2 Tax=unclassified Halobacteriovorax TaxID=2639665 RepID=UPI00371D0989
MRMTRIFPFLLGISLLSPTAFAGAKDDFINAVVKQCKKSKADAESMATPGRSGNVIKFKTCSGATVDVGNGCTLQCKDASSTIGG